MVSYTEDDVRQSLLSQIVALHLEARETGEEPTADVQARLAKAQALLEPEALTAFVAQLNAG